MEFIKIGQHIINTQYISHIDTNYLMQGGSAYVVAIYMIGFKGNLFSGGLEAENYSDHRPLSSDVIYLEGEDAEKFIAYYSSPQKVTVIN